MTASGRDTAEGRGRGRPPAQTPLVLPTHRPGEWWTGSVDPTELGRDPQSLTMTTAAHLDIKGQATGLFWLLR